MKNRYGGDENEKIRVCTPLGEGLVSGTSFAAPWIARKMAFLIHNLGMSREVAKALLIDSAAGWNRRDDLTHSVGYGVVPVKISDIVQTANDEIRFYMTGTTDEYETYTYNIPVPTYMDSVNQYIPNEERRIPLSNFIYIGDSETDIPAMKIVKQGGGTSIGVYNPINCDLDRVLQLLKQDRIDYLMPADYSEKSKIEKAVCSVLNEIHTKFKLKHLHSQQRAFVNDLEEVDEFAEYTEQFISDGDLTLEDINSIEKKSKKIIRKIKKNIIDAHVEVGGAVEIDMFVTKKQEYLKKKFDDKRKKISKKNSKQQGIQ